MWFLFVSFWERQFKQLTRIEIHGDFGSETKREDGFQSERKRMAFNKKRCRFTDIYYKKIAGSQLGLPRSSRFRVDPPGRLGFAGLNSRLVFSLTQPVPGPGRPAGPGFKTIILIPDLYLYSIKIQTNID
jgi:hypothetical protein